MLKLNNLGAPKGANRDRKRLGRGTGSGRQDRRDRRAIAGPPCRVRCGCDPVEVTALRAHCTGCSMGGNPLDCR